MCFKEGESEIYRCAPLFIHLELLLYILEIRLSLLHVLSHVDSLWRRFIDTLLCSVVPEMGKLG